MEGLTSFEIAAVWTVFALSLVGIGFAALLFSQVMARETGTDDMQQVWAGIKEQAAAYLGRQSRAIILVTIVLTLGAAASVLAIPPSSAASARFVETATLWAAVGRAAAFLAGALFAYLAAFVGMKVAIEATVRAAAAARTGYSAILQTAHRSGSVIGLFIVGAGVLGSTLIFIIFGTAAVDIAAGFGLGGALTALVLLVVSRTYIQALDEEPGQAGVDAEDALLDNNAAIAPLVGHTVRDCAVATATMFGAFALTVAAALMTGLMLGGSAAYRLSDGGYDMRFAIFPLLLCGVGVVASLIATMAVRTTEQRRNARAAMSRGFYIAAALCAIGFAAITSFALANPATGQVDWRPLLAALAGLVLSVALERITYTFAPTYFNPYRSVNRSSLFARLVMGRGLNIWGAITILVVVLTAILLYAGEPEATRLIAVFYSIALSGIGMLTLTGSIIPMDSFGAIAHTAHVIGTLVSLEKNARNAIEDLDETGKMSKGITRGMAASTVIIGVVALAGALFSAIGGF